MLLVMLFSSSYLVIVSLITKFTAGSHQVSIAFAPAHELNFLMALGYTCRFFTEIDPQLVCLLLAKRFILQGIIGDNAWGRGCVMSELIRLVKLLYSGSGALGKSILSNEAWLVRRLHLEVSWWPFEMYYAFRLIDNFLLSHIGRSLWGDARFLGM